MNAQTAVSTKALLRSTGITAILLGGLLSAGCSGSLPDIPYEVQLYHDAQECALIDMSITNQALIGNSITNTTDIEFEIVSITAHTGPNLKVETVYIFDEGETAFGIWPYPVSLSPYDSVLEAVETRSEDVAGQIVKPDSFRSFAVLVEVLEEGNVADSYLDNVKVILQDPFGNQYQTNYVESSRYIRTGDVESYRHTLPEGHICLPS